MENKQAHTPEVCHRITWAIIVDTRSFFDDIKLAEDFLEHGKYMQLPASTLGGDFMSVKDSIKIQRHNFPLEWSTPEPQHGPPGPYYPGRSGISNFNPFHPRQVCRYLHPAHGNNLHPNHPLSPTTGDRQISMTSAIQKLQR
jgi:hypothetical protein